jgi:hypothetical protein
MATEGMSTQFVAPLEGLVCGQRLIDKIVEMRD